MTDEVEGAFLRHEEVQRRTAWGRRVVAAGALVLAAGAAVALAGPTGAGVVVLGAGAVVLGVGAGSLFELRRLQRLRLGHGIDVAPFAPPPFRPGHPAPCPRCGTPGYLERIDSRNRRQWHRCQRCEHRWSLRIPERPR